LPPTLIGDLRRVSEKARQIARSRSGAQAQRLQPVFQFDLDHRAFRDYLELPALRDAVARVLQNAAHGTQTGLAVLFEPRTHPWTTGWHRDFRYTGHPQAVVERWKRDYCDLELFNQANCALYEDGCTWLVPGSHARENTQEEQSLVASDQLPPIPVPDVSTMGMEEAECTCLQYCSRMPGAIRILLDAGDYALYRSSMWHLGNYAPYKIRATLHDFVETDAYAEWRRWEKTQLGPR
jgi:ectoine hydroxylase-related dioxygenase (phytanoyl-CoA dioxygenase family)